MTTRHLSNEEVSSLKPEEIQAMVQADALAYTQEPVETDRFTPEQRQQILRTRDIPTERPADVISEPRIFAVYNKQTGDISYIGKNMLQYQLAKLDAPRSQGGQLLYTLNPEEAPSRPEKPFICWLHPQAPRRAEADAQGMAVCDKRMYTAQDIDDHVRVIHERAYKSFKATDDLKVRSEEADLRAKSLAMVGGQMNGGQWEEACEWCGISVFATMEQAAKTKLSVHERIECVVKMAADNPTEQDKLTADIGEQMLHNVQQVIEKPTFYEKCTKGGCEHVAEGKSKPGAMASLRGHVNREHSYDNNEA